jgi:MFS-type transporter involved in bile tolerance (Atg22 family)
MNNTVSSHQNLPRSIGAIVAGFLAGAILSLGVDAVLHLTGIFPPWGQPMSDGLFGLAAAYRTVFNVLGCYIAARLAPRNPMTHALAIGIIGLIVSIAGAIATWNKGPEFGPHWYPVILIVLCLPCAWLGGMLRERQLASQPVKSALTVN